MDSMNMGEFLQFLDDAKMIDAKVWHPSLS
jgi:hypothetical protein